MGRSCSFWLILILMLSLFGGMSVVIATPDYSFSGITSETHDLRISQVCSNVETLFERTVILSRVWDRLILNMTVQNHGDHLENVFLRITTNEAPIQASFSAFEQVGLLQAVSYQFEVPQTLVMTLNYSEQTQALLLEISVLLDFTTTLGTPKVDFTIQEAQLIALNLVEPLKRQTLPLIQVNQYLIQPVKYSFLKKNLYISPVLFVNIPENTQLHCTVSVLLHGTKIKYLTIDDQTFYPSETDFMINFNLSKTRSLVGQELFLSMVISPDYEGLNGPTQIVVETSVVGRLQPFASQQAINVLGAHPVPIIIMFPVLLVLLFGIPYYLVYQEHLSPREKNIIDPVNLYMGVIIGIVNLFKQH
ncbi:MAG: hypothetical protein ACFFC6_05545 [Promethearchaeota archaeon]